MSDTGDRKIEKTTRRQQIINVTEEVIQAVNTGNFEAYAKLCDPKVTAFEARTMGTLIEGIDFHKFYLDHEAEKRNRSMKVRILNPYVRLLGDDGAYIAYVKLTQYIDKSGKSHTTKSQETRLWHRKDNAWKNVHIHCNTVVKELIN